MDEIYFEVPKDLENLEITYELESLYFGEALRPPGTTPQHSAR